MNNESVKDYIDYSYQENNISDNAENNKFQFNTYVLDTSVLLYDPHCIFDFKEAEVIIPREVVLEIDKMKRSDRSISKKASKVIDILKEIFLPEQDRADFFMAEDYQPQPYLSLYKKDGGKITLFLNDPASYLFYGDDLIFLDDEEEVDDIEFNYQDFKMNTSEYNIFHYPGIEIDSRVNNYAKHFTDYMILQSCMYNRADLITRDKTLILFAMQFGVNTRYYEKEEEPLVTEKSYEKVYYNRKDIDELYQEKEIEFDDEVYNYEFDNNDLLELDSSSNSALARYVDGKIKLVDNHYAQGVKGKNSEQRFAIDALMDPDIDIVAITGEAGTGKTLLAISAAIEQVLEKEFYNKVLVCRPTFSYENENIGFLPGDEDEKTRPWLQPIFDNIAFIYGQKPSDIIEEFKARNIFDVQVLQYIRGRSIINQYFIVDEVQNLDNRQIKKVISRAGMNTKVVLTGDVSQIDNSYLSKKNNGLSYMIERFTGQNNFVHINLNKTERSRLADQATRLL